MSAIAPAQVTDAVPTLPSKLVVPSAPPGEVHRGRLDPAFDAGHQVVMVTAPAGYGKTTLVAGWMRRCVTEQVAWVSLDAFDRSPVSFWRHVTGALGRVAPAATEAEAVLVERGAPVPEFVATLIHAVCRADVPIVLVIDDLHHADPTTVRDQLPTVVERCTGRLRLVTTSRSDPPLPAGRWLAEDRAVEVRLESLAFRSDEAAALLDRFDPLALGEHEIERLNAHVEGWAVGLLLSGLALQGRPDASSSLDDLIHSQRHLTDYLVDEVLESLPDDLRSLALVLSVPSYFDHELAERLTGWHDAGAALDRLVRSNPYVVSVPSPPAYRFHHLFRSLLASTLRWTDADAYDRAHRTTAEVMVERGHVDCAVAALLEIGAVDEAFDVVTGPVLSTNDRGRVRELAQWLEMLGDVRPVDHRRALDYATALMLAGRTDDAIDALDRIPDAHGVDDQGLDTLHTTVRASALAASGLVEQAASELGVMRVDSGDVTGSTGLDSRVSGQIVRIALELGDVPWAEQWLPHVERHPDTPVSEVLAPALRAWAALRRGSVPAALGTAGAACAAAERLGLRPHFSAFDALLSKGTAELLALRLDDLATTMEALDADADAIGVPFFVLRLWWLRLHERAATQGWPAALELVETWRPEEHTRHVGRLTTRHDELRALAMLNCGRVEVVAPILDRLPAGARRSLLLARHHVVSGRSEAAEGELADHTTWDVPERLEATLLLSQARLGREARDTMAVALDLGRRSGLLAPFVLEGRRAQTVLADLPVDELFPDLAAWQRGGPAREPTGRCVGIVEPLTPKELAVLRWLPSHATYRAIGAGLCISINTVKTYVSAIYRKLGVSSRAEAVTVARQCGLLDD